MSIEGARFTLASKKKYESNPLLQPTELGKGKRPTQNIPDVTFGMKSPMDKEGVKEVVLTWKEHERNPDSPPPRDFMKLNKMTIKEKALDPKSMKEFRSTHDVRASLNKKQTKTVSQPLPSEKDPAHSYGMTVKYGETAKDLMENTFENEWVKAKEEEFLVMKKEAEKKKQKEKDRYQKRSSSPSKRPINPFFSGDPTPASPSKPTSNNSTSTEPFKMKRFKGVSAKVSTKRDPSPSKQQTQQLE